VKKIEAITQMCRAAISQQVERDKKPVVVSTTTPMAG
jgi:hypothetical protein